MTALFGAIIGLAVAAVLAIINSWLSDRETVADNIRDQRIRTYPAVWERTGVLSRWPRTDATRANAERLHVDLRTWYYSGGGLFLSEDAQARYEHLQVMLEVIIAKPADQPLPYDELMEAAHWFRSGLAEDLRTPQRHNLIGVWALRRRRRSEAGDAEEREHRVGAREYAGNGTTVRRPPNQGRPVDLTPEDERLRPVPSAPDGASPTPS